MTSCAPTDRLMQTLRVDLPGSGDELLQLQLFNVIDEFCRRTNAWRQETDITLEEGVVEYGLGIPADSAIVRVMGVSQNGVPVPPSNLPGITVSSIGFIDAEQVFPDGDALFAPATTGTEGGVLAWAVFRPDYLVVTSPPTEEARKYPFNAIVALTIAKSCLECDCGDWALPEWMFDMYFQDWLDGVQGRMFGMANKPWSNIQLAAYHGKRFRNQMAFRKQEAMRGFTFNRPAWRFPRVGGWV